MSWAGCVLDTQEVKTTWHPIEKGQGGGGGD